MVAPALALLDHTYAAAEAAEAAVAAVADADTHGTAHPAPLHWVGPPLLTRPSPWGGSTAEQASRSSPLPPAAEGGGGRADAEQRG